jgi:hypothetical protein
MPAFGMNALPESTSADHGGDAVNVHTGRLCYLFLADRVARLDPKIGKVPRRYVEQPNTRIVSFSQCPMVEMASLSRFLCGYVVKPRL